MDLTSFLAERALHVVSRFPLRASSPKPSQVNTESVTHVPCILDDDKCPNRIRPVIAPFLIVRLDNIPVYEPGNNMLGPYPIGYKTCLNYYPLMKNNRCSTTSGGASRAA